MSEWDESAREREEQKRIEREHARELEFRLCAAVRDLGRTKEGQDFLRWILAECHVFEQEPLQDEKVMAWMAGRRAFGLKVLGLCAKEKLTAAVLEQLREESDG